MFELPLATSTEEIPLERFWQSVLIYHDRPHVVNRRLMGIIPAVFVEICLKNDSVKNIVDLFTRHAILYEIRKLPSISKEFITDELVKNLVEPYDKNCDIISRNMEDFKSSQEGVYVSVRILLPRQQNHEKCVEVAILDKNHNSASFLAVMEQQNSALAPSFRYKMELKSDGIMRLCVENMEDADTNSAEWLCDALFTKLLKWANDNEFCTNIQQSLSLIAIDYYSELYFNLKNKYGKELVKIWPESTDPSKFVFEDIAIASYLISLWQASCDKKPSFVDLGCGNGLLVHILNQEGYAGYGIDVRKRKIWDMYPATTKLEIKTITPSAAALFPDTDWIIGNHSDELSPWIPVIAARSSHKTKFFVLPCCSYEFNGKKYKRSDTSKSQYTEYLEYIGRISDICGFKSEVDKLRIPSTKRTCIVGTSRVYEPKQFPDFDQRITNFINVRCDTDDAGNDDSKWVSSFEARPATEKVQNCTQIHKNVINSIINDIVEKLLKHTNYRSKHNGQNWNEGGLVPLPDLVTIITADDLQQLKNQCGGLQTLLKNHRYIFELNKGLVKLRVPDLYAQSKKVYKHKQCWFNKNHPDGCLHDAETCVYSHVD